ncbi:hypothetical protein LIER_40739 [Lithospermum erythrorhizon]|uniref:Peptidase A2 domain-containing protein n=1 Tax=Lithospermum erythrorhizon TaxID=34254 RepID=A0AAV3R242_LITER
MDTGSSADIITTHTYNIMKKDNTKLEPIKTPLIGFGGNEVEAMGKVRLEVISGEFPKCAIHEVDFLVVDLPHFAYNAIFGRPSLQKFKAVVAPYCLSVKFPSSKGEGILRSEQRIARECYLNSMKPVETKKSKVGDPTREPLGTDYEYSIKVEKEDLSSSDDER